MEKVKIRDLPFEEVEEHFYWAPPNAKEIWETQLRGKFVHLTGRFETYPHLNPPKIGWETDFSVDEEGYFWVCSTCAEIGD